MTDSRLPGLDALFADLRVVARGLVRERSFAAAAIVILTPAIALNTTVYTVMDAILFRGYPLVRRADRVVFLQERGPANQCCISYLDFEDWRAQATSFDGLVLVSGVSITFRDGNGRPMDMRARRLSTNTLSLLGVAPALGRDFTTDDARPGAPPVTLLNHRFWQRRFGGRVDVVGATVHIDGAPATVIGVLPERFEFPYKIDGDLWLPLVHTPELERRGLTPGGFTAVARLRDGVTLAEARTELETINRRLEAAYPDTNRGVVPIVATHAEMNSGPDAATTWGSLYAAAWFVLLVACANLANLMLVRTVGRWREFTTRLALGGGVGRVVRLVVLECIALSAIAGACAWGVTGWSIRAWDVVTASQYQVLDYSVHAGTAAYLVAITALVAVLVAIAPATGVRQLGVHGALVVDARGFTHGRRGRRLAGGLVAVQMALATVLLGGAGVLWRSFTAIVGADTGVADAERVLVGLARLPSDLYPTPEARRAYFTALEAQLAQLPGVDAVAVASTIPVRLAATRDVEIEGRPRLPMGEARVGFVVAGPDYFSVLDLPASAGRTFAATDTALGLPVAAVNERFAAAFWPGEDAVGKRLRTVSPQGQTEWRMVVGVVRNVLQGDPLRQQFKPLVYVPFAQEPVAAPAHYFLARASVPLEHLATVVQAQLQRLDGDVGLERFGSLDASFAFDRDFMDAEHSELGKHAKVAPIFAGIALLLAGIGLAAMLAHAVSQRTKEIGVRMAIGATARDIRRLVLHEGMRPVLAGLVMGLAASLAVNRLLQSQLVGVSAYDPPTLATALLLLCLVASLACQVPARRALRVDPVVALRHE